MSAVAILTGHYRCHSAQNIVRLGCHAHENSLIQADLNTL